jgi:Domain of unknown function (DUF4349)/Putative zinc-finger
MSATVHPFAPEEIMASVDGELSNDRAQSISAHIDQCAECHELAASLRSTSQTLSNWTVPRAQVNADLEDRIRIAAAKNSAPGESWISKIFQRTKLWTWKHWASGLAATAGLAMLLLSVGTSNKLRSRRVHTVSLPVPEQSAPVRQGAGFGNGPRDEALDRFGDGVLGRLQAREEKAMKEVPDRSWPQSEPMIARTVSLSIVARDFEAARASLDAVLARHNGYAAGLNVANPQGAPRTLQASLRIPAPQLAAAVAELKALGRVEAEAQNGEEVTQQHADLVARLKNSRETEQRLQDVLRTRTGKVKDVLEVEREIERVRGEIEQMEAEQQTLEHRVSFATIDLKLAEEYKAELNTPAPSIAVQLRNAIVDGFRTAFQSLLAFILFLAESGPTLLLWLLILSIPAWLLWRRYQRSFAIGSRAGL